MSQLSEKLLELLEQRGLRPADLSDSCTLEHSTLYQYLNGRRPIRKKEHLEAIIGLLQLTPSEQQSVEEAFRIEQLGLPLYNQRKAFGEFLHSLKETEAPSEDYAQMLQSAAASVITISPQADAICLRGEVATKGAVFFLLKNALLHDEPLELVLQPEHEDMLSALLLYGARARQSHIRHILCLDSDITAGRRHNLVMLQNILKYCVCCKNYASLYYYGHSSERFGCTNLLPGLILTSSAAIQLSWDGKTGLMYTKPEQIELFRQSVNEIADSCTKPLSVDCSVTLTSDYPRSTQFLRLTSDMCFGYLLTEEICREYLNPALPDYEGMLQGILTEVATSARFMAGKKTVTYMDPFYIRKFIRDGIPMEYPPQLYCKPFSKDCRRYFIEQKLQDSRSGKEKIHFFREGHYPMQRCWQLGVYPGEKLQLNYLMGDTVRVFSIPEPGITAAAADYLQALPDSPDVLGVEASEQLLASWRDEYL